MTDNPLVNFGDLTKPATVLIEKISDAVGGYYKPGQIVRVAKAEAEAERIRAESRIQVTDLEKRAMYRFLREEAKRQANMEEITRKALPLLEEDSSPEDVQNDWITNFFDKCRVVSDGDMQRLWCRVLAGEANAPGAFSRRTVNLLNDLDKTDAELFARLLGFAWHIKGVTSPLVFDPENEMYQRYGIDYDSLGNLDSLGLVQYHGALGFIKEHFPKKLSVSYFGKPIDLTFSNESDNGLGVGAVLLTRAGHELAKVCEPHPVDGFFDFVYDIWAEYSLVPKREAQAGVPTEG